MAGIQLKRGSGAPSSLLNGEPAFDYTYKNLYVGYGGSIYKIAGLGGSIVGTSRIDHTDSPYTVLVTDTHIFCDTGGGDVTVNLPAGVAGTYYRIINTSTGQVTITPNGAEDLLGDNSSFVLMNRETLVIVYESTEGWF